MDEDGTGFAEYEGNGISAPIRMAWRGRDKLIYYYREPLELFELANDPDEFADLARRPEHTSVKKELTQIVLRRPGPSRDQPTIAGQPASSPDCPQKSMSTN